MNMFRCRAMKVRAVVLALLALVALSHAAMASTVGVVNDASGSRLQVDGRDMMLHGVNWDYIPIGHNYMFDLWSQPDDVIIAALDNEFGLMRAMGVNAIRVYTGIPPRWVKFIYEKYGIWTMLNHPAGRYGFTIDGVWHPASHASGQRGKRSQRFSPVL